MNPLSRVCIRPKKEVIWAQRRKKQIFGPKRAILGNRGQKTARRAAKRAPTRKPKVSRVTLGHGEDIIPLSQVSLRPKKGVIWAQRRKKQIQGKNRPKMPFFEESRGFFGSQEADFCSKCLVLSHYKLLGWWHSYILISPIYRYTLTILSHFH